MISVHSIERECRRIPGEGRRARPQGENEKTDPKGNSLVVIHNRCRQLFHGKTMHLHARRSAHVCVCPRDNLLDLFPEEVEMT